MRTAVLAVIAALGASCAGTSPTSANPTGALVGAWVIDPDGGALFLEIYFRTDGKWATVTRSGGATVCYEGDSYVADGSKVTLRKGSTVSDRAYSWMDAGNTLRLSADPYPGPGDLAYQRKDARGDHSCADP